MNTSKNKSDIPILAKLGEAYKTWHLYIEHLPKITRYTLGAKIDTLFTECIELALLASHESRDKKGETLVKLNTKFDTLKFFFRLLWEVKGINTNVFTGISTQLAEIGRMIGGWMKHSR